MALGLSNTMQCQENVHKPLPDELSMFTNTWQSLSLKLQMKATSDLHSVAWSTKISIHSRSLLLQN